MRPLILRHRWMTIAPLLTALFFILSIYDHYRTPPIFQDVDYGMRAPGRETTALPLLLAAMNKLAPLTSPDEEKDAEKPELAKRSSIVPSPFQGGEKGSWPLRSFHNMPLHIEYPPEIREMLRSFVARNEEALSLIDEAVTCNYFATFEQLRNVCRYTDYLAPAKPRPINRALYEGVETFTIANIIAVTNAAVVDAMLDDDVESFIVAAERSFALAALSFRGVAPPKTLLENIFYLCETLKTIEQGVNRMNFDAQALEQLRRIIAEHCYHKSKAISDSYRYRLSLARQELENAWRVAYMPPEGDYPYVTGFELMGGTWMTLGSLAHLGKLHHLRCAVKAGEYLYFGGEASFVNTPKITPESSWMHRYAKDGTWFNPQVEVPPLNAITALATGLFEETQALWPYQSDYEPYLIVLAYARAADTALAAAQYRLDNGRLPDTLKQLIPDYMITPPMAPYAWQQPLNYHRYEDHIVVFSSGVTQELYRYKYTTFPPNISRPVRTRFAFVLLDQSKEEKGVHDPGSNMESSLRPCLQTTIYKTLGGGFRFASPSLRK